jgi:dipeptidase
VALGGATTRGASLFGKNSDRERDEAQPVVQIGPGVHPPGARVRCTHLEIPQVRETAAVLGSGPFWCWGLEQGANEHGVVIGNESVFTHEELELPETGLLGMDLLRLGLERSRSAAEAVRVLGELIERHGQGGKGWLHINLGYSNGFLIADRDEAWTLQTSARRWAARRVRAEAESISNQLSIGDDWELASPDLESFAQERGWWSPERGRIDFAAAYRSTRLFQAYASEGRLHRSRALLEADRGRIDERCLFNLLRDHGEGAAVPPRVEKTAEDYYTLCAHNEVQQDTAASLVAALDRPTRWLALAAPCTGIYLPLSLDGRVPEVLRRAGPEPSDDSAWWRFKRLQQATEREFEKRLPRVREAFAPLEELWLAEETQAGDASERMERATAQALEATDRLLGAFDA